MVHVSNIFWFFQIASLMGFTWIFGYMAAFTDVEALWYIYIILNSLQGLFIFISFMCNRRVGMLWCTKLKVCGIAGGKSSSTSSSGMTSRHRTVKGTQMTKLSSNMGSEPDGSDQPLNGTRH